MNELCRVAKEVRVYPLLSISTNTKSKHLELVISKLTEMGISILLVPVDYEFQKGATEMLVAKYVQHGPLRDAPNVGLYFVRLCKRHQAIRSFYLHFQLELTP